MHVLSGFGAFGDKFLLSMQISSHAESALPDLSRNGLEPFGGLWWSWPLSQIPCPLLNLFLHCAVLCCADLQEPKQGHLSQESAALALMGPFSGHILFFPTECSHQQSCKETWMEWGLPWDVLWDCVAAACPALVCWDYWTAMGIREN